MSLRKWFLALTCAAPLVASGAVLAGDKLLTKEPVSLGSLRTLSPDEARTQSLDWLKGVGKTDDTTMKEFNSIWSQEDRSLTDRVADTLALGDADAAKVLKEARDATAAAPLAVPGNLTDAKKPAFYRSNLALAYAKALSGRRVHEEALDTLRAIKPGEVADPGAYFFHRAVAEHALLLKKEAHQSIVGLLEDVSDSPERYKALAGHMFYDMLSWQDKDLGEISRKMDNIERRLQLARGGPHTQKIQKDVVARLDELIKKLENQAKGCCACNGGGCPGGGQPGNGGGAQPSSPMQDSNVATNGGPGNVDNKRLKGLAEQWGKLPEKERIKAMAELTRDLPPRYRQQIEDYFKKQAASQQSP